MIRGNRQILKALGIQDPVPLTEEEVTHERLKGLDFAILQQGKTVLNSRIGRPLEWLVLGTQTGRFQTTSSLRDEIMPVAPMPEPKVSFYDDR